VTQEATTWIVVSGANHHVTSDLNNLSSFYVYNGPDTLQIGNGFGLPISHIGSSSFIISNISIKLTKVLYVPNFTTNLLSLSKLLLNNPSLSINFTSSICIIKDLYIKTPQLQIPNVNGLYTLKLKPSPKFSIEHSPQAFVTSRLTTSIWHARLGPTSTTIKVINTNILPCIREYFSFCNDCIQTKTHTLHFSSSNSSTSSPLELIHSDVWGPFPIVSSHGYKYYISFIDDYSHFTWIYFMKHKSEVCHIFSLFKAQVESLLEKNIKIHRTDGGTEFKPILTKFPHLIHQETCPYTP
jgi:Integrase core domain